MCIMSPPFFAAFTLLNMNSLSTLLKYHGHPHDSSYLSRYEDACDIWNNELWVNENDSEDPGCAGWRLSFWLHFITTFITVRCDETQEWSPRTLYVERKWGSVFFQRKCLEFSVEIRCWGQGVWFIYFCMFCLFWSAWDFIVILNNAFFCMWCRDKAALNVSSQIWGCPIQGPGKPTLSTPLSPWR